MSDLPIPAARVAPHLREANFRIYEPYIAAAVDAWPAETEFTPPSDVMPSTFVVNMRNAILSVKMYQWPNSRVSLPKLLSIDREYVINQDAAGHVWFRKRKSTGKNPVLGTEQTIHSSLPSLPLSVVPWRDPTDEELRALCVLIHYQRLTGPVVIEGEVANETRIALSADFNVAVVYDEKMKQTIIT